MEMIAVPTWYLLRSLMGAEERMSFALLSVHIQVTTATVTIMDSRAYLYQWQSTRSAVCLSSSFFLNTSQNFQQRWKAPQIWVLNFNNSKYSDIQSIFWRIVYTLTFLLDIFVDCSGEKKYQTEEKYFVQYIDWNNFKFTISHFWIFLLLTDHLTSPILSIFIKGLGSNIPATHEAFACGGADNTVTIYGTPPGPSPHPSNIRKNTDSVGESGQTGPQMLRSYPLSAPVLCLDSFGPYVACSLMDGGHAVVSRHSHSIL